MPFPASHHLFLRKIIKHGALKLLLHKPKYFSQQVKSYNISVTVAYPPDTDTPGFAEESQNKVTS